MHDPRGSEDILLRMTLNQLEAIKNGADSHHQLEFMATYPDLSDCETTYVSTDPNAKPSHRLIWRELPAEEPGGPVVREAIALGERAKGAAYHLAGHRLGRPIGVSLTELTGHPEPVAQDQRIPRSRPPEPPSSTTSEHELEGP